MKSEKLKMKNEEWKWGMKNEERKIKNRGWKERYFFLLFVMVCSFGINNSGTASVYICGFIFITISFNF